MSKLAQVGDLGDGVDTSVPGIEHSDLNDGDILARTRENVNPNGLFQWVYIPDDGSEHITSDWVDQEHKKKLTRQWVDGVKDAIISRSQEKIRAAREAALEERAKRIRDEQFADPEPVGRSDNRKHTQSDRLDYEENSQNPQGVQSSDPGEYISTQLAIAEKRLNYLKEQQNAIFKQVIDAESDYSRWSKLATALGLRPADRPEPQSLRGIGDDQRRIPDVRSDRQVYILGNGRN